MERERRLEGVAPASGRWVQGAVVLLVAVAILAVAGSAQAQQADADGPAAYGLESQDDSCEVEQNPGTAHPDHFSFSCTGLVDTDEVSLTIEMSDAWAYRFHIELPDDAPRDMRRFDVNQAPGASTDELDRREAYWAAVTGKRGDDWVTVINTNPIHFFTRDGTVFYEHAEFEQSIHLEPGVYDVELVAHPQLFVPDDDITVSVQDPPEEQLDDVRSQTDAKQSRTRIAVGDCDLDYRQPETSELDELDRRELEALSDIADANRNFEWARFKFTARSAVAGGKLGATLVSAGTLGPTIGSDAANLVDQMKNGREAVRAKKEAMEDLSAVLRERTTIQEELMRCHGREYQVPDDYQRLTPEDRNEAKQPDGDTVKG